MCVLALAAMRGELRMVCTYREDWRSDPSLEEGTIVTNDSALRSTRDKGSESEENAAL